MPIVGDKLVMFGATVKLTPLLASPPTVTTTFPVVAALGTGTTMLVALQLVGTAVVPLKVTVLVPWEEPKFVPVIVTDDPTIPAVGERLVMVGAALVAPAVLKAANTAPQLSDEESDALAAAFPKFGWT